LHIEKKECFRTPVRWLKFRPEKPMGEILEEGDKDDEEKKGGTEGQEGTEKNTAESREGGNEVATVIKEVCVYIWSVFIV